MVYLIVFVALLVAVIGLSIANVIVKRKRNKLNQDNNEEE